MTDSSYLLDPEVEAILQEVAKDPNSVLLRVDRPKELRVLLDGGDTIARSKTGLSKAEKQLLEVHRDEAAYLLRLAYYELARRVTEERARGLILYSTGHQVPRFTDADLGERLRRQRALMPSDVRACGAIDVGLDLLARPGSRLVDLASLSLRLVPSGSALSYVGSEYMIAGYWRSAESVYWRLVEEPAHAHIKACCITGVANALARRGRLDESREEYRRATEISVGHNRVLSWLMMAIGTGCSSQAKEALRLVDQLWPTPDVGVTAWTSAMEKQRRSKLWTLDVSRKPVVSAMMKLAKSPSARLVLGTMMMEAEG